MYAVCQQTSLLFPSPQLNKFLECCLVFSKVLCKQTNSVVLPAGIFPQKKKKKSNKTLTFKRSISLMQSCLALASIISKIFKDKKAEDSSEMVTKSKSLFSKELAFASHLCMASTAVSAHTYSPQTSNKRSLYFEATEGLTAG